MNAGYKCLNGRSLEITITVPLSLVCSYNDEVIFFFCNSSQFRVDINRGSVYCVQQASWEKLYNFRKIWVVCLRFLIKQVIFCSAYCLYFHIFCLHFKGANSFLSLRLFSIDVYKICSLNICQNRSLKQTSADSAVCVLYEPHFLLEYYTNV